MLRTVIDRRPVSIQPRARIEVSAFTTDSRDEPIQPASSCWENGRSITTPPSLSVPY